MLRLLFAGTPEVAVPSLYALAQDTEHYEIAAVLTRPDAPQGRGRKLMANPVKQAAQTLGIPVIELAPSDPKFLATLQGVDAQAAAVVAYGHLLKQQVLDALPLGWYNLHFSLLPQWRGAAPVQRAIWSGEQLTGVSVFRITAGMDAGPIVAQMTTSIGAHENAGDLLNRLAHEGSRVLAAALTTVADGTARPVEQPAGSYETAAKISVDDAHVRWDVPVFAVDRQIRACTPAPGAWTRFVNDVEDGTDGGSCADNGNHAEDGVLVHIMQAKPYEAEAHQSADRSALRDAAAVSTLPPLNAGQLYATKHHVWVGTATQPLELLEVKPQGKRTMSAADWARGAHVSEQAYMR